MLPQPAVIPFAVRQVPIPRLQPLQAQQAVMACRLHVRYGVTELDVQQKSGRDVMKILLSSLRIALSGDLKAEPRS